MLIIGNAGHRQKEFPTPRRKDAVFGNSPGGQGGNSKSEIRNKQTQNPKSETEKYEIRNPKSETNSKRQIPMLHAVAPGSATFRTLLFRCSEFVSDFGFWILNFGRRPIFLVACPPSFRFALYAAGVMMEA
jgi:hypothetical protein